MGKLSEKWTNFQPSKGLWLWSCVGMVVVTMIVGFGMAGWVTEGTAQERAETSTDEAVAQLAATICKHRFLTSVDAVKQYEELGELSRWKRRDFIEDGGWTTFANMDGPVDGAAKLCATLVMGSDGPIIDTAVDTASDSVMNSDQEDAKDSDLETSTVDKPQA